MALVAEYRQCCKELKVKPNSRVAAVLPPDRSSLTSLDLSDNVLGGSGLNALCSVLRGARNLSTLNLRGNNLTAPSVQRMVAALKEAEALRSLDLSANDIRLAGPELLELVKANRGIRDLRLTDTHLRPLFANLIASQIRKNEKAGAAAAAGGGQEPGTFTADCGGEDGVSHEQLKRYSFGEQPAEKDDKAALSQTGDWKANMSPPNSPADQSGFDADPPAFAAGFAGFDGVAIAAPAAAKRTSEPKKQPGGLGGGLGAGLMPQQRRPRQSVCAEAMTAEDIDSFKPKVHAKKDDEVDFLMMALERNNLFSHLDDRELRVAVDAMTEITRAAGEPVYEQGDEDLDMFYIIWTGELSLWVGDRDGSGDDGPMSPTQTKVLRKSDHFGELFLLYPTSASESVRTERESTLFCLDRKTYKFILSQASKKKRALYGGFLQKVPFLQSLSSAELMQLADSLKGSVYDDGAAMIKYGEEGSWLHIVVEGTVEVIGRDPRMNKVKVCEFTVGDCVGELEFINNHQTVADVLAKGRVRTAKMNRRHFEKVMGPVIELLRKNADKLEVYSYYRETLARVKAQQS